MAHSLRFKVLLTLAILLASTFLVNSTIVPHSSFLKSASASGGGGSGLPPFGIDGYSSAQSQTSVSSLTATLSTNYTNDVIVVYAFSAHENSEKLRVSGASLSWNTRVNDYVLDPSTSIRQFNPAR